jgi:hypothetical protein
MTVPTLAPWFTTNVLEELDTFAHTASRPDEYLKSILGVNQGQKYGETVSVSGKPEETFGSVRIVSPSTDRGSTPHAC